MVEPEVLVVGRSCMDIVLVVDGYPPEDHKTAVRLRTIEGGGQGGTAACCVRRLGGSVAYIGKVGDDEAGSFCLERLQNFGVDTRGVERVRGGHTPVASIVVNAESGTRTIFYEPSDLPRIDATKVFSSKAAAKPIVLLDPEVTYLAGDARSAAGSLYRLVYDCERQRPGLRDMMERADYFIPSEEFLSPENGFADNAPLAQRIRSLGRRVRGRLIVTCGARGAVVAGGDRLLEIEAPSVAVRDTIGAGDNFHAAFALAVHRGGTLLEAAKLAVAVASLSCTRYGGREGIPTMDEAAQVAAGLKVAELG
ncbi:MAG: carbohydrate kinase family protein [Desulfobacteraceae bacterium]|nr:carbohydrate kinase family protein [Desulfobacteraceae bacterium]